MKSTWTLIFFLFFLKILTLKGISCFFLQVWINTNKCLNFSYFFSSLYTRNELILSSKKIVLIKFFSTQDLWWNRRTEQRKRPILMICYTNHALDQFLEMIIRNCKLTAGVVRIGGQCKSEELAPYLLKNIKTKNKNTK